MTMPLRAASRSGEVESGLPWQIERAFEGIPYPGDWRLVDNPQDWEAEEIAAVFRRRHWKTVPMEALCLHYNSLTFFTPEAYRFYLPAYLLATLKWCNSSSRVPVTGYGIQNAVVWSLIPPKHKGAAMDHFLARINGFTEEQKLTIRDFLLWIVKREGKHHLLHSTRTAPLSDAEIALRRYWAKWTGHP